MLFKHSSEIKVLPTKMGILSFCDLPNNDQRQCEKFILALQKIVVEFVYSEFYLEAINEGKCCFKEYGI